jgi:hypothetical protein
MARCSFARGKAAVTASQLLCDRCISGPSPEARETIEEGERRRAQIEAVIADLEIRRDDALADLDRLRGGLSATIAGYCPAGPANGRDGERATKEPAKA